MCVANTLLRRIIILYMTVLIPHGDTISDTYVRLTQKFFGGDVMAHNHLNRAIGNPDIVEWGKNQVYEVKGSHYSDRHMMRHAQIEDYKSVQGLDLFPLDHPEVYYLLWTHKVQPVDGKEKSELEGLLLRNTISFLALSFGIILQGRQHWKGSNTPGWQPYTAFAATIRNGFLTSPGKALSDIGLDKNNYTIKKKRVSRRRMNGKSISEFQATIIHRDDLEGLSFR